MAGNLPDLRVEIGFGAYWNATSLSWTDVSAYVMQNPGVQITRGRPNELATFSAGRCTFTLNNNDGRFTPFNASGPYYGDLVPRVQVVVTATWASTDYTLFRGFVTGWPQTYSKGKKLATVQVECYDGLAILNEIQLADMYYGYMRNNVGSLAMSLRRISDRAWIDRYNGTVWPSRSSNLSVAADLAAGLAASDAVLFDGTFGMTGGSPVVTTTPYTVSMWFKTTYTAAEQYLMSGDNGTSSPTAIYMNTAGVVTLSNDSDVAGTSRNLADGKVHHVVFTYDTTGPALKCYVDGELDSTGSISSASTLYTQRIGWGGASGALGVGYFNGTIQEPTVFSKALSATEVRTLYNVGIGAVRESTTTRMGRVLDSAGWPSSWRDLATNTYGRCAESWESGTSSLAQLQLVAATEQGAMFVGRTGSLILRSRYRHQLDSTATTVQATFSDDGSDQPYANVGYDYDDLEILNSHTVTASGLSASSADNTSVVTYGQQDSSVATQLGVYEHCLTMAQGLTYWRKDPQIRTRPLTAYPQTKTSTWGTMLALDLTQRVKFEITAPGVGSQYAQELLIQQMDWRLNAAEWTLTVQGSPVPTSFGKEATAVLGTDRIGF